MPETREHWAQRIEPMARSTDPLSSFLAADKVKASGAARKQREKVLAAVRLFASAGPRTAAEIAQEAHLDRFVVCRRMIDLVRLDQVIEHKKVRRCSVLGSLCNTYEPARTAPGQARMF